MPHDTEAIDKRFERYAIIRAELDKAGVSRVIVGGIHKDNYTVRCQICGWIGEADNAQDAARIGWQHDANRVKWGCPIRFLNGKNKKQGR